MEKKDMPIMLRSDAITRIKVTCRCGMTTVHEFPHFVLHHPEEVRPMFECSNKLCHTVYTIIDRDLVRLDSNLEPEKVIAPDVVHGNAVMPTDVDFPSKHIVPGSKAVN